MSKLLDYLNHLDSDATAVAAHNADPAAAMTQFGLDAAEQQALMTGDAAAIANLAGIDVAAMPNTQISNGEFTKPI